MMATADADVVIVGSGVVGALIAHQLVRAGKSILVLEAGPRLNHSDVVERWRNVSFERRIAATSRGRVRNRSSRRRRCVSPQTSTWA